MEQSWSLDLEKELIKKTKRNSRYFEAIYDQYFDRIYRFIYKKVSDETLAEEFTSDTFYKALLKIKSYDEERLSFSSWLYKIALNEMRMYFRKSKTRSFVFCTEELMRELAVDDPGDALTEELGILESVLLRLPEQDLAILELRFYENMPFKDIADIQQLSEGAVKMRTKRAITKLREEFAHADR